jgi:hypothetical protein
MTIDCLLHHPLVVALEYVPEADLGSVDWFCRTAVPDADRYDYQAKPRVCRRAPLSAADMSVLASRWLQRRGVRVHCTNVGMLEPARRRLWVADIAGERDDRLLVAATYYSLRRRGKARRQMREYAASLAEVCRSCYRIGNASMALINVYGDGKTEGEFLPDGPP